MSEITRMTVMALPLKMETCKITKNLNDRNCVKVEPEVDKQTQIFT